MSLAQFLQTYSKKGKEVNYCNWKFSNYTIAIITLKWYKVFGQITTTILKSAFNDSNDDKSDNNNITFIESCATHSAKSFIYIV